MRKFYLCETPGGTLTDISTQAVMLRNPTGLGATANNASASLRGGFYAITSSDWAQNDVVGTLTFTGSDPYAAYKSFCDKWLSFDSFVLGYQPGNTIFYRNVGLKYITKGELTSPSVLEAPIAFFPFCPWYKLQRYTKSAASSLSASFQVSNQLGCGWRLRGTITSAGPVQISQNGSVVFKTETDATAGSSLDLRNVPSDVAAVITTSGVATRGNVDIMNTTIPVLGPKTGTLAITGPSLSSVDLEVYEYYRSV